MRLDVGVLRAEKFFRAVNRELLDRVHVFATAIPAFFRIALGIFVREHGALRFQYRRADKIFTCDQFDVFLLAHALMFDGFGHGGIHVAQTELRRGRPDIHFVDAAFVASTLEFRADERVENFPAQFRRSIFAAEAENVRVVVLPRQRRALFIGDERGAHARHFVGGHAHANAARANEQAEFHLSRRNRLCHRPGKIGIIVARFL